MSTWIGDLLLMIGAFTLASLIAVATNTSLGHAFTYGQLAFGATAVYVLLRR